MSPTRAQQGVAICLQGLPGAFGIAAGWPAAAAAATGPPQPQQAAHCRTPEHARAKVAASPVRSRSSGRGGAGVPPRSTAAAGVAASTRAAQRLAAAAALTAPVAAIPTSAAAAAQQQTAQHGRAIRSEPGGLFDMEIQSTAEGRGQNDRVPNLRPSAAGSPAARSVRRRLDV